MAPKKHKSLIEELADLDNPAPREFDPEEEAIPDEDSGEDDSSDEGSDTEAAREHYVDVGKSKLRKKDAPALLGPRYTGATISRDALLDVDEDDDDPFSKGFDEGESESEDEDADDGMGGDDGDSDEDEGSDEEGDEEEEIVDGDDTSATDLSDDEKDTAIPVTKQYNDNDGARSQLRKMMAEEQKTVAASLSEAAKADAEKGRAVKKQRAAFDSLLNIRVKLQKALIGTNTINGMSQRQRETSEEGRPSKQEEGEEEAAFKSAEEAALSLWTSLTDLRDDLDRARTNSTGHKRKRQTFTDASTTTDLLAYADSQDAASKPLLSNTLEKWATRARSASTTAAATQPRLNNANPQSLTSVLKEHLLADSSRLVSRTQTPRSCAPWHVDRKIAHDERIYDDADFYGLLLQDLLEQRSADSVAVAAVTGSGTKLSGAGGIDASFQLRREAKTKRNVDTRASKGRKLRYTVHEKLENFMAPEDRGAWGDRQADELFGSLFGRKMGLGEGGRDDEDEEGDEDDADMVDVRNGDGAGLRLFGN